MTAVPELENELMHARVYDPVKAHEYYLRTRHLKGRRRSSAGVSSRPGGGGHQGGTGGLSNDVLRDSRRESLDERIEDLQAKVDRLRELLRERVSAAKKRAGVDEPKKDDKESKTKESKDSKDSKTESKKDDKSDRKLTEQEKREKRKASKEQYEKENRTSKAREVEALKNTIKNLREQLSKLPQPASNGQPPRGRRDQRDGGNGR